MDTATARLRLERMVAWDQAPALTSIEVDDLLNLGKRADQDGREPTDVDWEPTWALGPAAAEGWRWKAARVAGHFGFSADGSTLQKEQVLAHCLRMAEVFAGTPGTPVRAGSGAGTIELGHGRDLTDVIGNLNL